MLDPLPGLGLDRSRPGVASRPALDSGPKRQLTTPKFTRRVRGTRRTNCFQSTYRVQVVARVLRLEANVCANNPAQHSFYDKRESSDDATGTRAAGRYNGSAAAALNGLLDSGFISLVRHPMNFLDETSPTRYSSRAAAASAAAADAGRFHEYARLLFEHQPPEGSPGLSDDQLIELGNEIGMVTSGFAEAVQQGTYLPWPSYVTERATEKGVAGTPSVFVDGIPVRPDPVQSLRRSSVSFPSIAETAFA